MLYDDANIIYQTTATNLTSQIIVGLNLEEHHYVMLIVATAYLPWCKENVQPD